MRIATDERYLAGQDPLISSVFNQVRQNAISVGDYLQNISFFLTNSITYSEADLPQEAAAVLLNRQAHCIGYANVAQTLLACVGIASRPVNGFYLRENNAGSNRCRTAGWRSICPENAGFFTIRSTRIFLRATWSPTRVSFSTASSASWESLSRKTKKYWMNEVATWKNSSPSGWKN